MACRVNVIDITSFYVLMAGIACLAFIGDKAFHANRLCKYLAGGRLEAVIPMCKGTSGHPPHDAVAPICGYANMGLAPSRLRRQA